MESVAHPGAGTFYLWLPDEDGEITPEKMAHMVSNIVLSALARPSRSHDDPSWKPMSREQEDLEYTMADARRGLQIRKGE
jgi:hypothetical protein